MGEFGVFLQPLPDDKDVLHAYGWQWHEVSPVSILLWEGADLDYVFSKDTPSTEHGMRAGLRRKLHYAVETGIPDFSLKRDGES